MDFRKAPMPEKLLDALNAERLREHLGLPSAATDQEVSEAWRKKYPLGELAAETVIKRD